MQEPDTDELLEQFGKEYDEDETLESLHTPKSQSPPKHEAEKSVRSHELPERGSSETVDDALFLAPGKPGAPAKQRVNRTMVIAGCIVLIMMSVAVYFIGLPMLTDKNPQAAEITHTGTNQCRHNHSSPDKNIHPGLPCFHPPANANDTPQARNSTSRSRKTR